MPRLNLSNKNKNIMTKLQQVSPSVKCSCAVAKIEFILQHTNSVISSSVSKECKVGLTLSYSHCQSCLISCSVRAVAITKKIMYV